MKISGIYKIQSISHPDRCYIGSAVNIKNRWRLHLYWLRLNKHDNSRLQNHFNKYTESDLSFSILLPCERDVLIKNEQYFIDTLNPYFNICRVAGSSLGVLHSEETKERYRMIRKGTKPSRKCIEQSLLSRKGKPLPDSVKLKLRESHLGKTHTEETRKLLSTINTGKKLSEEHRRKISEGGKGRSPSQETRDKISASNKGHATSEETRRKISEALKGRGFGYKKGVSHGLGRKLSEDTRLKISKSLKGHPGHLQGKKFSEETRRKISIAKKKYWAEKRIA